MKVFSSPVAESTSGPDGPSQADAPTRSQARAGGALSGWAAGPIGALAAPFAPSSGYGKGSGTPSPRLVHLGSTRPPRPGAFAPRQETRGPRGGRRRPGRSALAGRSRLRSGTSSAAGCARPRPEAATGARRTCPRAPPPGLMMAAAARRVSRAQRRRSPASGMIVWRKRRPSDPSCDSYTATRSGSARHAISCVALQADVAARACCGREYVQVGRGPKGSCLGNCITRVV